MIWNSIFLPRSRSSTYVVPSSRGSPAMFQTFGGRGRVYHAPLVYFNLNTSSFVCYLAGVIEPMKSSWGRHGLQFFHHSGSVPLLLSLSNKGHSRRYWQKCANRGSLCRSLYELRVYSEWCREFRGLWTEEGCALTHVLAWSFWPLWEAREVVGKPTRRLSASPRPEEVGRGLRWRAGCSWEMVRLWV